MTSRNARLALLGSLLSGVCFLTGIVGASQLPKLRSWILVEIETQSREHSPVRVLPASVDIDFVPLGVTARGVRILPKDELKDIVEPLEIKRVSATISLWQLLQGKLRLSSVEIQGTHVVVALPKSEKKTGKPLEGLFNLVGQIPISRFRLDDVSVDARVPDPKLHVLIEALDFKAEKLRGGFSAEIDNAAVLIEDPDQKATVRLDVEAGLAATPSQISLDHLKIRRGDSFFTASGHGQGDIEALQMKDYETSIRAEVFLESMRAWAGKTFPNFEKVPQFKGRLFVDGRLKSPRGKSPTGDFEARAEEFKIDGVGLGHLETSGTYKNDVVRLPKLTIKNPAGTASIEDIALDLHKVGGQNHVGLEGALKISSMNIYELLYQFGVGTANDRIPVSMMVSGELPCKGTIRPEFALECKATVAAKDIVVQDGASKTRSTIVRIPQMRGAGTVHIDDNAVSYKADLTMPDSKGRSEGTIGFQTGFKIGFEGDRVSFKDVANLANLKLEGVARVKGTTEGTSKTGKVTLNLDGSDMWFEDFWLGNVKGGISYGANQLKFTDLSGNAGVSRYNGDVGLDLHTKRIAVNARLPFFDTRDVLKIFSRRVQLSFPVLGTGQGQIRASGPLDLGHLSYDLRTSVFRGSVAGESFDSAHFDVKSIGGEVKAERVQMSKGPALISLQGVAHPDGKIETTLRGRGLRLEDTNTIAKSGVAISGAVDFDMTMNGPILSPDTDMKGTLTKTSIGEASMPDSNFRLKFTKATIEGGGKFLGDVVDGEFMIPLNDQAPFKLKASTKDWNFAPLFASISGPASRKDYEGHLTTSIDFASQTGGFWNANGTASIEKFSLARGTLKLANVKPMSIVLRNGQVKPEGVSLTGENIFLNVEQAAQPTSKLDLMANGKIDLGLLELMTPFFEDLRGLLSFKIGVKGGNVPTNLIGSAYIEKGYLKFFDFPHAFEDIRADLLFNQQKVLFNTIRSEFGGGRISANGNMEIKGFRNTPLALNGTFEKITLRVPDKIQTSGSGDFKITGSNFPFLFTGIYRVSDGLVTKSFGGDSDTGSSLNRRDAYLPDFLVQENFVPLVLDFTVDLSKGVAVRNELVDGRGLGTLTLKGNPTHPAMGGTLAAARETKVIFRDTNFDVTNASIQFNGSTEVDPKVYVAARTRIDPYDVNLVVQGTGLKPELLLSSTPQLAERDIISLLAFGSTDSNLDQKGKTDQQALNVGSLGGSNIVKHNPISDAVKERLGFDVQFTTGFDDTNTSVQKIIATRQLGQNLSVSGGYSYGKQQSAEGHVRYRLNDRLSVVGAWTENNYTEVNIQQQIIESQPNVFGLDMEYKFEFK